MALDIKKEENIYDKCGSVMVLAKWNVVLNRKEDDMSFFYDKIDKTWRMEPFSKLSPIDGIVPAAPFEFLPILASKARGMLTNRSKTEIIDAAYLINGVIETYYDSVRGQIIIDLLNQYPDPEGLLRREGGLDWEDTIELDRRINDIEDIICGGIIPGIDLQVPDIPTRNDVSDVESLKVVERFLGYQGGSLANGLPYEYFAVLALCYVEECIELISSWGTLIDLPNQNDSGSTMATNLQIVLAAQPFAYAIEAVCYGEHLVELHRLGVAQKVSEESMDDAVKNAAKELGRRGAFAKHAETRQLREQVYAHYVENESKFINMSAEKIAIELRKVVYLSHRKLAEYASEFKKIRSAGRP